MYYATDSHRKLMVVEVSFPCSGGEESALHNKTKQWLQRKLLKLLHTVLAFVENFVTFPFKYGMHLSNKKLCVLDPFTWESEGK